MKKIFLSGIVCFFIFSSFTFATDLQNSEDVDKLIPIIKKLELLWVKKRSSLTIFVHMIDKILKKWWISGDAEFLLSYLKGYLMALPVNLMTKTPFGDYNFSKRYWLTQHFIVFNDGKKVEVINIFEELLQYFNADPRSWPYWIFYQTEIIRIGSKIYFSTWKPNPKNMWSWPHTSYIHAYDLESKEDVIIYTVEDESIYTSVVWYQSWLLILTKERVDFSGGPCSNLRTKQEDEVRWFYSLPLSTPTSLSRYTLPKAVKEYIQQEFDTCRKLMGLE
jgi:hypothetical protein